VHEDVLDRIADRTAGIARLGVDADVADLLLDPVDRAVDVEVAIAGEVLEDGDCRVGDDGADQLFAATGDDQVDVAVELEQWGDEGAVGVVDELDGPGR
jgi:hypothetical protein